MLHKFDREALEHIEKAIDEAQATRSKQAGVWHLLLALIREEDGAPRRLLSQLGLSPRKLLRAVLQEIREGRKEEPRRARPWPWLRRRRPKKQPWSPARHATAPHDWERFQAGCPSEPGGPPEKQGAAAAPTVREERYRRHAPPSLRYLEDPIGEWDRALDEIESDARLVRRLQGWILQGRVRAKRCPAWEPAEDAVPDEPVPGRKSEPPLRWHREEALRILDAMSDLLQAYPRAMAAVCLRHFRGRSEAEIRVLLDVTESDVPELLRQGLELLYGRLEVY